MRGMAVEQIQDNSLMHNEQRNIEPRENATEAPVVKPKDNDVALTKNKGFARAMNQYMKGQRIPRKERRKYIATKGWLNNA